MSLVILIVLIVLGFFGVGVVEESSCSADADGCVATVTVTAWIPVEIHGVPGVIVAEADGGLFLAADGFWTPSEADIAAAEDAIEAAQGDLDHLRQYVGYVEDGERKILVNGFATDLGIDWRSQPVLVDDGGEAFFTAVYNVDTGELENFAFNGVA